MAILPKAIYNFNVFAIKNLNDIPHNNRKNAKIHMKTKEVQAQKQTYNSIEQKKGTIIKSIQYGHLSLTRVSKQIGEDIAFSTNGAG